MQGNKKKVRVFVRHRKTRESIILNLHFVCWPESLSYRKTGPSLDLFSHKQHEALCCPFEDFDSEVALLRFVREVRDRLLDYLNQSLEIVECFHPEKKILSLINILKLKTFRNPNFLLLSIFQATMDKPTYIESVFTFTKKLNLKTFCLLFRQASLLINYMSWQHFKFNSYMGCMKNYKNKTMWTSHCEV